MTYGGDHFALYTKSESLCCTVQFSSVAQSSLTLCDSMDCSMPGFSVCQQLLQLAQTQVHRVGDTSHPTISLSVVPFFSCLQSFPTSGSFLMSQPFASGVQSIGASASASILPMNIQMISFKIDWFDLLAVQGTLKCLFQHHSSKSYQFLVLSFLYSPTLTSIHDY